MGMNDKEKVLYKIHADYRLDNPVKNNYYVLAHSRKEAKTMLLDLLTGFKIFSVEECSQEESESILSDPWNHVIIGDRLAPRIEIYDFGLR